MKTIRLSVFVAILALILAVSCATPDNWVTVKGNKFVDPQGNELIFRGLCFSICLHLHWSGGETCCQGEGL